MWCSDLHVTCQSLKLHVQIKYLLTGSNIAEGCVCLITSITCNDNQATVKFTSSPMETIRMDAGTWMLLVRIWKYRWLRCYMHIWARRPGFLLDQTVLNALYGQERYYQHYNRRRCRRRRHYHRRRRHHHRHHRSRRGHHCRRHHHHRSRRGHQCRHHHHRRHHHRRRHHNHYRHRHHHHFRADCLTSRLLTCHHDGNK